MLDIEGRMENLDFVLSDIFRNSLGHFKQEYKQIWHFKKIIQVLIYIVSWGYNCPHHHATTYRALNMCHTII